MWAAEEQVEGCGLLETQTERPRPRTPQEQRSIHLATPSQSGVWGLSDGRGGHIPALWSLQTLETTPTTLVTTPPASFSCPCFVLTFPYETFTTLSVGG